MIGRKVLHYAVTAELGAGAMGRVYLARDERTDRLVALKFLSPEATGNAEARARLVREAAAVARLSHPNIVALYAVEETAGEIFLVEEYVEGESLARRLQRGSLGPQELLRLAHALASALAHAHRHGVLHRDLKPANVLLATDGTVKVADFGIARVAGSATLTTAGAVLGSAAYLAPERVRGSQGDARAELFALGAVLYEAMSGRRAFPGENEAEVLYGVLHTEPRPTEAPTSALLPLAALVMRLLAKEPADRPASAEAVLEALEVLRPAGPVLAARRRAWLLPVAGAAALVLLASTVWWLRGRLVPTPAGVESSVAVLSFDNLLDPQDPGRIGPITGSLLVTSLAQAPRLNVLSTQRILEAVQQVGRGATTLDRAAALLVAKRVHAARIVTGSILQIAPAIVMTAEVSDVRTGRVLYAERAEGEPGQTVFQVVDGLGARLTARMAGSGEATRLAPVTQRTSADLEAQRRYVQGMERFAEGDLAQADSGFAAAVALDASFVQAWYRLAITRWWGNEPETARADILKARASAARLPPPEREMIEALDDLVNLRMAAAVPRFERLAAERPEDKLVLYGLEEARFHSGDLAGTVAIARRILALDPGFTLAGRHLLDALAGLGRFDEAQTLGNDLLRRSPHGELLYGGLLGVALTRLDAAGLLRLQSLREQAGFRSAAPAVALLAVARDSMAVVPRLLVGGDAPRWLREQGRLDAAYFAALRRGRFHEAQRIASLAWSPAAAREPAALHNIPWADGLWPALMTRDSTLGLRYVDSIAVRVGRVGLMPAEHYREIARAVVWIAVGPLDRARRSAERVDRLPAERTPPVEGMRHLVRALILRLEDRDREALEELKSARWFGFTEMAPEVALERARVLARLGRHAEALAVIDSLIRCPMLYPDEAVRLHLYRGQALEGLGRDREAAAEYRRFLDIWKDADPGRPEVTEGRAALARLERTPRTPTTGRR
jgi:serine/threonine-protein kinase